MFKDFVISVVVAALICVVLLIAGSFAIWTPFWLWDWPIEDRILARVLYILLVFAVWVTSPEWGR